jgi:hypothetical protein
MIKKYLLLLVISVLFSQPEDCSGDRYISEIFDVDIEYGIEYGENINQTLLGSDYTETLYMDIYTPSNDFIDNRPLIFFMFGGSFIGGSKSSGDIVALCTKYAQRGYVAVAIDYRLSPVLIFNPTEEVAYKAVLKAVHDVKAAIRYFKMMDETSASTYKIDSDRVFVGGVSAGAISAVNAGYLNTYEEVPSFLLDDYDEVGGIEGLSGNPGYSSEFHGIVNLCGAVGSQDWIVEDDIPVVSMHGDQDDVVPYDDNLVTLFGLNIQIDGSYIIHQKMTDLDNYTALHTYVGQGHTPFSSMVFESEYTSDFLYDIVCSESENYILGDINYDGIINILDIVVIINFVLGISEPSNNDLVASDMNLDGLINVLDIVALVNIILNN